MGQFGDLHETEHAGQPLQRMGAPENGVDQIGAALTAFGAVTETQQIQAQLIDNLFGLRKEILDCLPNSIITFSHVSHNHS